MKLRNSTDIPNEVIRDAVRFARPPGIKLRLVKITNCRASYRGWGSWVGVCVRLNTEARYPRILHPYQYGQLRGRRYYLASLVEALIYVLAHELMHTKQGQRGNCRGRVWGARGRYSEIETESYAIRKLREWRRQKKLTL
jgi:hypothetical protein